MKPLSITRKKLTEWSRNLFLGWWVLLVCVILQVLNAGLLMQAYGAYVAVMKEEFPWSKTLFSLGFSLMLLTGGLLGPWQGYSLTHFGSRLVIRTGLIILAVGLILFSYTNSLTSFYLAIFVMSIGGSLSGFLSLNTVAVQWFRRWRGLALSLMQTGISIAGLLVPLLALCLVAFGWRNTALGSSLLALTIGLPLTKLIYNNPEELGLTPDGKALTKSDTSNGLSKGISYDLTLEEALQTRAFWFISFGHAVALMIVSAVLVHLVIFLEEDLGFSLQSAANTIAFMTTMTITGQLLGGFLSDKFNKRLLATCAMLGHALALLVLVYSKSIIGVLIFSGLHGLSWGIRGPIMQSIRADYFGRAAFAKIMGFSTPIVTLGFVLGPLIAGYLADAFGNYQVGFTVLASLAACGSGFFAFAKSPIYKV